MKKIFFSILLLLSTKMIFGMQNQNPLNLAAAYNPGPGPAAIILLLQAGLNVNLQNALAGQHPVVPINANAQHAPRSIRRVR